MDIGPFSRYIGQIGLAFLWFNASVRAEDFSALLSNVETIETLVDSSPSEALELGNQILKAWPASAPMDAWFKLEIALCWAEGNLGRYEEKQIRNSNIESRNKDRRSENQNSKFKIQNGTRLIRT